MGGNFISLNRTLRKASYTLIVLIIVVNALPNALFMGCIILPDCTGQRLATTYYFIGLRLYIQIETALGTGLWRCGEGEQYKNHIN